MTVFDCAIESVKAPVEGSKLSMSQGNGYCMVLTVPDREPTGSVRPQ